MLKKDDVMTTQGINVSMAYVEKSSAKAGTELALQVGAKMICPKTKDCSQHHQEYKWDCQNQHQKIFSWIIKSTNKIVQIHIKYDPGERKRYSSDSHQDAVCTDQLFHRGEVKTFYNYQFFARMRDFVRRINTLHLLRLFLLFHGCLVCLMDHSRWWKDDHIQDDRTLLSSLG